MKPWFIAKMRQDDRGETLYAAKPEVAGEDAERVLDERNAFLMTNLMRDVVRYGTAAPRDDARAARTSPGKTGHDQRPHRRAGSPGFQRPLVAVSWIGFDTPAQPRAQRNRGRRGRLPIWMAYVTKALKGVPGGELRAARRAWWR